MKEYKLPRRRQPIFSIVKKTMRLFFRVKVENRAGELPDKAIIVGNHSAKSGPVAYELYYPKFNVTWGAHEMLGNYKSRYLYLRNVFYIQKQGRGKVYATLKSAFEAIFSKMFYRGIKVLPTYTDMRFLYTVRNSMAVLDDGASLVIFPEDSNEGYRDEIISAYPGFVMLAEQYFIKTGEDLPIIPVYFHKASKKIIIDTPETVEQLKAQGLSRTEIVNHFVERINNLYRENFKAKDREKENAEVR